MIKVFLLHPDQDFDLSSPLPPLIDDVIRDIGLPILFEAMAQGDEFVLQVVRQVVLSSLTEITPILYRQDILKDCIQHPDVVRQLYQIPLAFLERKRKRWLWISSFRASPSSLLSGARELLEISLDLLRRLRQIADQHIPTFTSLGFRRFFTMIQHELDDEYLAQVEQHIQQLRFPRGVLLRAQLGKGNEGNDYVLCRPNNVGRNWLQRLFTAHTPVYSYTLHPRDDAGFQVLGELRDQGLARTASVVAQAAAHIEHFFEVLQRELAFYIGCLNLYRQLTQLDQPVTFPQLAPADERYCSCIGLYDVALALTMKTSVIGNDIAADGKSLLIITGPNRGGKTVFLRSLGQAQMMMQCGMFVPAAAFRANLVSALFTHFRREEDKTMVKGKFEEELARMSTIVDHLTPNAMLLLNEAFAATNEREGSEIAGQIVRALLDKKIKIYCVTHLFEFTRSFIGKDNVLFLRAERLPDGRRTFKIKEGIPLETSYGADLYRKIFGVETTDG